MSVSNLLFDLPIELQSAIYCYDNEKEKMNEVIEEIETIAYCYKRCKNCGDRDIEKDYCCYEESDLYINMYGVGNYKNNLCVGCYEEFVKNFYFN
tara:strand:+ start:3589 stop:3873 length:285 start_codon:yes stop_codon:yes gene_type:complete